MQVWGTCGRREHSKWPVSENLLPKVQRNIATTHNSIISRYLGSWSSEDSGDPHSFPFFFSLGR